MERIISDPNQLNEANITDMIPETNNSTVDLEGMHTIDNMRSFVNLLHENGLDIVDATVLLLASFSSPTKPLSRVIYKDAIVQGYLKDPIISDSSEYSHDFDIGNVIKKAKQEGHCIASNNKRGIYLAEYLDQEPSNEQYLSLRLLVNKAVNLANSAEDPIQNNDFAHLLFEEEISDGKLNSWQAIRLFNNDIKLWFLSHPDLNPKFQLLKNASAYFYKSKDQIKTHTDENETILKIIQADNLLKEPSSEPKEHGLSDADIQRITSYHPLKYQISQEIEDYALRCMNSGSFLLNDMTTEKIQEIVSQLNYYFSSKNLNFAPSRSSKTSNDYRIHALFSSIAERETGLKSIRKTLDYLKYRQNNPPFVLRYEATRDGLSVQLVGDRGQESSRQVIKKKVTLSSNGNKIEVESSDQIKIMNHLLRNPITRYGKLYTLISRADQGVNPLSALEFSALMQSVDTNFSKWGLGVQQLDIDNELLTHYYRLVPLEKDHVGPKMLDFIPSIESDSMLNPKLKRKRAPNHGTIRL